MTGPPTDRPFVEEYPERMDETGMRLLTTQEIMMSTLLLIAWTGLLVLSYLVAVHLLKKLNMY